MDLTVRELLQFIVDHEDKDVPESVCLSNINTGEFAATTAESMLHGLPEVVANSKVVKFTSATRKYTYEEKMNIFYKL